jgi:hypothetical protein
MIGLVGRRRLLLLLVLALAAPTSPTFGDEPENPAARKKRLEEAKRAAAAEEKALVEKVNAAIDLGAKWLVAQQDPQGVWPSRAAESLETDKGRQGVQAFCLLTLLKCGADDKDPAVKLGLDRWKDLYQADKDASVLRTYDAGVSLMMLDALYNPTEKPPKDMKYIAPKKGKCKYTKEAEDWARTLVEFLVTSRNVEALGWRYPNAGSDGSVDLSNTQYAVLGLWAAARCGFDAPPAVWEAVVDYCLKNQAPEGPAVDRWIENPAYEPGGVDRYGPFLPAGKDQARGWAYLPGTQTWTGSMTTAGLAALAIAKDRLRAANRLDKGIEKDIDRSMTDGIAWMSSNFAVEKNPGVASDNGWHFYYLYGLERAGALAGLVHFGKHDWYREGARYLLSRQSADGGWPVDAPERTAIHQTRVLETCFALLFLRRATIVPAKPVGPTLTGG